MAVDQLASPLALNTIVPGTEEDTWGPYINANWVLIRQAIVDVIATSTAKADLVAGKIPSNQLPALNAIAVTPVADQAARLASGASLNSAVLQLDNGTIYVLTTAPATTNGNWTSVNPGVSVTSVNGEAGAISGFAKLTVNDQSFTGTGNGFANPLVVANATGDTHAVNRGQLNSAIAAVAPGTIVSQAFLFGDGTTKTFNVDHNRGSYNVVVAAQDVDTGEVIGIKATHTTTNRVVVVVETAPATNKLRIVCIG